MECNLDPGWLSRDQELLRFGDAGVVGCLVRVVGGRGGDSTATGAVPRFLDHREVMDRLLDLESGATAWDMLVEEAEGFGQQREPRAGLVARVADMGAGAVVPGAEEHTLVRVREGVAAADAVVREVLGHAGEVGLGGHGCGGERRVVAEASAAKAELDDEVGEIEVGGMVPQGCGEKSATGAGPARPGLLK